MQAFDAELVKKKHEELQVQLNKIKLDAESAFGVVIYTPAVIALSRALGTESVLKVIEQSIAAYPVDVADWLDVNKLKTIAESSKEHRQRSERDYTAIIDYCRAIEQMAAAAAKSAADLRNICTGESPVADSPPECRDENAHNAIDSPIIAHTTTAGGHTSVSSTLAANAPTTSVSVSPGGIGDVMMRFAMHHDVSPSQCKLWYSQMKPFFDIRLSYVLSYRIEFGEHALTFDVFYIGNSATIIKSECGTVDGNNFAIDDRVHHLAIKSRQWRCEITMYAMRPIMGMLFMQDGNRELLAMTHAEMHLVRISTAPPAKVSTPARKVDPESCRRVFGDD